MATVEFVFSLRYPKTFNWRVDPNYDAGIQRRLMAAHAQVMRPVPGIERRPKVAAALLKLSGHVMSIRQQMLLFYLLAQCMRSRDLAVSENFAQALEYCARAEQLAVAPMNLGAQVDLHELKGTLHRAVSLYWLAAEEFSTALRVLYEHTEENDSLDAEFEVTLASKAAAMDYALGNFPRALDHLRRAESLLSLLAMSEEARGTLAWTFALVHRQANDHAEAQKRVREAASAFLQMGARNSTCRVLSLAANIVLDAVEAVDTADVATREGYFVQAAQFIENAIRCGAEAEDIPGAQLAELSLARLERLRGVGGSRGPERRIRAVMRQAREMHDVSLLTEAQTALGFDYLTTGDRIKSKHWLTSAVASAKKMHAPGLGHLAERGLRRLR